MTMHIKRIYGSLLSTLTKTVHKPRSTSLAPYPFRILARTAEGRFLVPYNPSISYRRHSAAIPA